MVAWESIESFLVGFAVIAFIYACIREPYTCRVAREDFERNHSELMKILGKGDDQCVK